VVLPFWISIALLSLAQGALVAVPGTLRDVLPARLRSRRWAVIPPLSVIAFVFGARAAEHASAQGLTYLALAAVTPPRWLAAGIVAMALADTALVVSDLLQQPNNALNAARPVAGLPQLQDATFGSAVMGYGDLFIAAALGGLLAATLGRSLQLRAAALTALLAMSFDLLFFLVDELPATVPVALALIVTVLTRRVRFSFSRGTRRARRGGVAPGARDARQPRARASP
jgi:hypothetical protein